MKITRLVSLTYKTKEEKRLAEESFELFKSIEGAEVFKLPTEIKSISSDSFPIYLLNVLR